MQEYAGTQRNDFLAPSYAGPWETWWALVRPTAPVPTTSGNLIISEFRLRGPQGVRDEFVEVYNPGATPIIVSVADNSEGWGLGVQHERHGHHRRGRHPERHGHPGARPLSPGQQP